MQDDLMTRNTSLEKISSSKEKKYPRYESIFLNLESQWSEKEFKDSLLLLRKGGILLIPTPVGFTLTTTRCKTLTQLFNIKRRDTKKNFSILGNQIIISSLFGDILGRQVDHLFHTVGLLGHPKKEKLSLVSPFARKENRVSIFLNLGPIAERLIGELWRREILLYGTSANLSGNGNHYLIKEVEDEILSQADKVIPINIKVAESTTPPRPASPIFDFEKNIFIRKGLYQKKVEKELFNSGIMS